jgi:hypothetical protein
MGAPYPILPNGLATSQGIWDITTSPVVAVGTRAALSDGRVFYYAKNSSSSAIVAGNSLSTELQTAQFATLACAETAVGATSVAITLGSTTVTADEYKDGYLCIEAGTTGAGITYAIKSNTAAAGTATCTVTLHESINVALHADATVQMIKNPWCDVIIAATGDGHLVTGVSQVAVLAGDSTPYYFWCQTWGISCGWQDDTTAVGIVMSSGTNVAGQFDVQADGDQTCALNIWTVTTQGENNPVWLTVSA